MNRPVFSTSLDDPDGHLQMKLESLMPQLHLRFSGIAAVITRQTAEGITRLFESNGAKTAQVDADLDSIGAHRRQSLEMAIGLGSDVPILRADLDHVLRWIERDPDKLGEVVSKVGEAEFTVIGRSAASLQILPQRLRSTEAIVNHVYSLITGQRWDLMMSARAMTKSAVELIVKSSVVDTVGNDVDWPLLCRANGLAVAYLEADGLTYMTEEDYALDRSDTLDAAPEEWAFRVLIANQQIDAMRPYMDGST